MRPPIPLTLDALLSDPIVRALMRSDGVTAEYMVAVWRAARAARLSDREPRALRLDNVTDTDSPALPSQRPVRRVPLAGVGAGVAPDPAAGARVSRRARPRSPVAWAGKRP